jgi:hypothetical protein
MDQTLLLGFSQDAARKARALYRTVLGAVLIIEAAAGLSLLLWPASVGRILGDGAGPPDGLRVWGVLLLIIAALLWSGRIEPARSKLLNLMGIVGRLAAGVALIVAGKCLLWAGVAEVVAGLALAQFYFQYFAAEVMSRP